MRYMMIVKHKEAQGMPPKELMDAIGKLTEQAINDGTLLGNGGLLPTAAGANARLSRGRGAVTGGAFTGATENNCGYELFELKSKGEAVEGARHFMELHKKHWPGWEGETEVRQIFGPEAFAESCPGQPRTSQKQAS